MPGEHGALTSVAVGVEVCGVAMWMSADGSNSGDAVSAVLDRVRDVVRTRGHGSDEHDLRATIADVMDAQIAQDPRGLGPRQSALIAEQVENEISGFGPLQPLFDDETVEEIWWNEPSRVWCARRGRSELTTIVLGEGAARDLVERMLASSGRRVDVSSPFVDAVLVDGSRLHVAIPDVTRRHWVVNIRKHVAPASRLDDLVA